VKKIGLLENNQKPKINVRSGVIYFFEALNIADIDKIEEYDKKYIKFGKTSNTKNRFNTYNSGNVNSIEPLFILEVDNIDKVEGCVKNLLIDYQYRKNKEIYLINMDVLKIAADMCDELISGFVRCERKDGEQKFKESVSKMKHADSFIMKIGSK